MKKITLVLIAAITAGGLITAATVHAKRGGDRGERMVEMATEKLSLDTNQVEALQGLQAELQETRELMRGDSDIRSDLQALVGAESFDQGEALVMINERIEALQANAPELVAAAGLFLDGLDAEQREDVVGFMERMGERHRGGHRQGDE